MVDIHLRKLQWIHCPGHAGVKRNDRADRLAGKATLASGLLFGWSEVLRSLRHYLRAQSQDHHTTDRLEERGSARRSSLKGRERAIVNQTNIATVLKATLGKLLRERIIMGFSERIDIILNLTELKWSDPSRLFVLAATRCSRNWGAKSRRQSNVFKLAATRE